VCFLLNFKFFTYDSGHANASHGKQLKPLNVCFLVDGSLKLLCSFFSQVTDAAFKDLGAVFETLHWDILKETGYMSWFGLAFTLAGYLSSYCQGEVRSGARDKWLSFKAQTDFIAEQLDELKLCLEVDNDIYKLAAGTLLYCCAVIRHMKSKNRG
jgi:hypothetical protein